MITREEMIGLLRENRATIKDYQNGLFDAHVTPGEYVEPGEISRELEGYQKQIEQIDSVIAALQAAEPVAWIGEEELDGLAMHRRNDFPAGAMVLAIKAGSAKFPLFTLPCPPAKAQIKPVVGSVGYLSRGDARWMAYCPDNGPEFFKDKASAEVRAAELIQGWLDSDGWAEEAGHVFVAQITDQATECDVVHRPPDDQLDEDGLDVYGNWWDADWDRICNFKLQPVAVAPAQAQVPDDWRTELETIAEILEADGDEWHCAARIRKILKTSPAPEHIGDGSEVVEAAQEVLAWAEMLRGIKVCDTETGPSLDRLKAAIDACHQQEEAER